MRCINNNILIGSPHSKARFDNAKNVCQDCYYKLNTFKGWVSWNISPAEYCEVCERSSNECSKTGLMIKDIKEFKGD